MENMSDNSDFKMKPFNFAQEELQGFRYRAKDAVKMVTRVAIREARMKELSQEIMKAKMISVSSNQILYIQIKHSSYHLIQI